ncbi:MAG TPA: DUF167 domain-containing protein [Burkholderiaceae bacterium]|nr:DUF167 domain-containing protein [Burkholderiaceae bacterium]
MASREGRRDRKQGEPAEPLDSRTHVDSEQREWLRQSGPDALLHLHVRPGSKVAAVLGPYNGRLKIAIDAPPVEGKANAALLDYLASVLRRPRRQLHLERGAAGRDKMVRIEDAVAADIASRLDAALPRPGRK